MCDPLRDHVRPTARPQCGTDHGSLYQGVLSWMGPLFLIVLLVGPSSALQLKSVLATRAGRPVCVETAPMTLSEPAQRDAHYKGNIAQYLVDLHDAKHPFDFCGGMLFQLVLSDKLRSHLVRAAAGDGEQPVLYESPINRMAKIPGHTKSAEADNVHIFHGREVRQVPDAAGGMGFVLQLTLAGEDDPEGWTPQEVAGYDGWGHDSSRTWRKGDRLEDEGYQTFRNTFGGAAYTLHHRFYLHKDFRSQLWLSAEDGCEGQPYEPNAWDNLKAKVPFL